MQCITNFVSMDLMANALLAIGASPAMVRGSQLIELPPYSMSLQAARKTHLEGCKLVPDPSDMLRDSQARA